MVTCAPCGRSRMLFAVSLLSLCGAGVLGVPGRADAQNAATLLLKDARTGKPIRGAQVRFLPLGTGVRRAALERRLLLQDAERLLKREGKKLKSDASGHVVLPEFAGAALVGARWKKLWGVLHLAGPPPEEREWLLRPEVRLSAQVKNRAGKGQKGVPVELLVTRAGRSLVLARRLSASRGRVRFRNLERGQGPWSLALGLPLAAPQVEHVDLQHPPLKPVVLSLPPTGSVRVDVRDQTGAQISGATVLLSRVADGAAGNSQQRRQFAAVLRKGQARFARVGLGLDLEVLVRDPEGALVTWRGTLKGPQHAADVARVTVTFGVRRPVLAGRLVDSSGDALGHVNLAASFRRVFRFDGSGILDLAQLLGGTFAARARTDEQGAFKLSLDRDPASVTAERLRLSRVLDMGDGGQDSVLLLDNVKLKLPLAPGETDLGRLAVPDTPTLVSGIVFDSQGHGLAQVGLQLQVRMGKRWLAQEGLLDGSDADGLFSIRGVCRPGKVRIVAQKQGWYLDEPVAFERGESRCKIRLQAGCSLAGAFLLPAGLQPSILRVRLGGEAARNNSRRFDATDASLPVVVGFSGAFRVRGLRPGKASLRVGLGGTEEDLLKLEHLDVVLGPNRPAELAAIDLSKVIPRVTITVKDAAGKPLTGAVVWLRRHQEKAWLRHLTDPQGRAQFFGQKGAFDLDVMAPGYLVQHRLQLKGDATISLEPARPVPISLALPAGVAMPDPPLFIKARLVWVDPKAEAQGPGLAGMQPMQSQDISGVFGKDRRVELALTEPGTWQVLILVRRGSGQGGLFSFLNEGALPREEANRFVLKPGETLISKVVKVNLAMLKAQLARFAGR